MSRSSIVAAMIVAFAGVARAQNGWEARLTMAPNPLPGGRCGGIVVEIVDDHGYRRSTLSNGANIDVRNFKFTVSDPSHVTVQNDASVGGRVCADTGAKASKVTVTGTSPDGLVGTLQLVLAAKGTSVTHAVAYRPQAPLRLPTSPDFAPGFVAAGQANGASSGGGAGAGGAAGGAGAAGGGAAGGANGGAAGGATGGPAGAGAGAGGGAAGGGAPPQGATALVITKPLTLTGAKQAASPQKPSTP